MTNYDDIAKDNYEVSNQVQWLKDNTLQNNLDKLYVKNISSVFPGETTGNLTINDIAIINPNEKTLTLSNLSTSHHICIKTDSIEWLDNSGRTLTSIQLTPLNGRDIQTQLYNIIVNRFYITITDTLSTTLMRLDQLGNLSIKGTLQQNQNL